jgi:hypothetical protein
LILDFEKIEYLKLISYFNKIAAAQECVAAIHIMGFSLLSASIRVSQKEKRSTHETINHLLCGWWTKCYTKKSPFRYNRVVQALLQKGKVIYGE